MICKVCGSEFNSENFDLCPFCLTPIEKEDKNENTIATITEVISIQETNTNETIHIFQPKENVAQIIDDYEVTAEDLIEEEDNCSDDEIMIDELGLSVRAVNAFRRANIHTLGDLIHFLAVNNVSDLRNVGAKTILETENLIRKLQAEGIESLKVTPAMNDNVSESTIFANISTDLDYLSIDALLELGVTHKTVSEFIKNDIRCCGALRVLSKKQISTIVDRRHMEKMPEVATFLEKDIISLLKYVLDNHRGSREYNVFLRRAQGETLQDIADNPDKKEEGKLSRERVRQIERSFTKSIGPYVRELFYILKGDNNFVSVQDLLDIYDDDEFDQIILYACKAFDEFEYLDFADIFVEGVKDYSVESRLFSIIAEIVEDGLDISDKREVIEDALQEYKLDYIDIESVVNLLKKNGYHVYGNFIVKGRSNYSTICMYLIKKYFSNGIKLSQSDSEQSDDLKKLRKIIEEKYNGISMPSSDRAVSSTLVRNGLVLRGRGQYILQEFVSMDEELLAEIKNSIDKKSTDKVFYNEIYAEFEGALNIVCGIDNYNYLHGVLMLRYPDTYEYSRDFLLKNGAIEKDTESIADRIFAYICKKGRPVSKTELFQEFRGFSNVMLMMPFVDDTRLMQWEYNYYTCSGLMDISEVDKENLRECILAIFKENHGYASDGILFEKLSDIRPDFIQKNRIKSEMNLHYIVAKTFADEMDFKRPHIGKKNQIDLSSTKSVVLYLLGNPVEFTFKEYNDVVERMKWSRVTASAVLSDIEQDYVRISLDNYLLKDKLMASEAILSKLWEVIGDKFENGILSLINLEMDDFPEWEFQWNEFIVEAVLKRYFSDIEVIQPTMKDRRYQRGIAVQKACGIFSYSQVVAIKMKEYGYEQMTESQFLTFLVVHNLAKKAIPNELTNSEFVRKEGDFFKVI